MPCGLLGYREVASSSSVGWVMKSLKLLSVPLGHFHGKRRRDMQQNIMANDHTSTF